MNKASSNSPDKDKTKQNWMNENTNKTNSNVKKATSSLIQNDFLNFDFIDPSANNKNDFNVNNDAFFQNANSFKFEIETKHSISKDLTNRSKSPNIVLANSNKGHNNYNKLPNNAEKKSKSPITQTNEKGNQDVYKFFK